MVNIGCVVFIVLASITFLWLLYVARNAYFIVLPGLKHSFYIWLIHLVYMTLVCTSGIVRPAWTTEMSQVAFDSPFLCHFFGRFYSSITAFTSYSVTTYGFSKVKLYMTLARNKTLCLKALYISLFLGIILNGVVVLLCFITVKSGQTMENGYRFCVTINPIWVMAKYFEVVCYIFLNIVIIGIFFKFRNLRDDSVPDLHNQMLINLYVVPFLFGTTIFIHLANIVIVPNTIKTKDTGVVFYLLSNMVDNLLNNMAMYWNIFGTINKDFYDDDDFDISEELREIDLDDIAEMKQVTGYVWVCLPGAHPLKVKSSVVIQNGLQSHIIFKEKRLRQIKKYRERGFVRSLLGCCNNTDELIDELSTMQVHQNHIFVE